MTKSKVNISASIDISIEKKIRSEASRTDRNFSYTINKYLQEALK